MAHRSRLAALVTGLLICLSLACASIGFIAPKPTATRAASTSTLAPTTALGSGPASTAAEAGTETPAPEAASTATSPAAPSPTPTEVSGASATVIPSQTGSPGHTGPSDIPVFSGSIKILTATDMQVIYQTDADVTTIVKFYSDQMPQNGWTLGTTVTTVAPPTTNIIFKKDNRTADVSIVSPPGAAQRLVTIVITSA